MIVFCLFLQTKTLVLFSNYTIIENSKGCIIMSEKTVKQILKNAKKKCNHSLYEEKKEFDDQIAYKICRKYENYIDTMRIHFMNIAELCRYEHISRTTFYKYKNFTLQYNQFLVIEAKLDYNLEQSIKNFEYIERKLKYCLEKDVKDEKEELEFENEQERKELQKDRTLIISVLKDYFKRGCNF